MTFRVSWHGSVVERRTRDRKGSLSLSLSLSVCLFLSLSLSVPLSLSFSVCLCISLSVSLSLSASVLCQSLSVSLSVCRSVGRSVCLGSCSIFHVHTTRLHVPTNQRRRLWYICQEWFGAFRWDRYLLINMLLFWLFPPLVLRRWASFTSSDTNSKEENR